MRPMAASDRSPVRPTLRRTGRRGAWLLGLLLAATITGCSLPTTETPPPDTDPAEAPLGSSTPDPARDALIAEVEHLQATIATARDELAAALDAEGPAAAQRAAEAALEVLVADAGATGADQGEGPRPLFAAETLDRDDADEDAPDQLTHTLTRARDVGGSLGNTVIDLLRDPIAGDLGAWQRDAGGVLAAIDETLRATSTLEEREVAVAELPGLGTRAIAWSRLTATARATDDARAYAERGLANLDVILVTLDRLEAGS